MPYFPLTSGAAKGVFTEDPAIKKRTDKWERGQELRKKLNDMLVTKLALPLYDAGYPTVGSYLTGAINTGADLVLPETNEDLAALPFGSLKRGGKLMSNAVDLLTPEMRDRIMQRQNAIQAVREAIQKHKGGKAKLGAGSDMGAYDAEGVIVKSPRFSPFQDDYYDKADAKLRRTSKVMENVQRLDPEQAKIVAQRDIDAKKRQLANEATQRFVMDQDLEYAGLAPDTFMVKTSNNTPYIVQEKADKILSDENFSDTKFKAIENSLREKIEDNTALSPSDLRPPNIGVFGKDYKVIDSGNFEGISLDEAQDEANSSWRFIQSLFKK